MPMRSHIEQLSKRLENLIVSQYLHEYTQIREEKGTEERNTYFTNY